MKQELKEAAYTLSLKGYTEREIARHLNVSDTTVHRAITSVTKSSDYNLALKTIGQFLTDYNRAGDYFKMQLRELEDIKNRLDSELDEGADERGRPFTSKLSITELRLKIIGMQADLNTRVLEHVRQGQVSKALQALRDGKLRIDGVVQKAEVINKQVLEQKFPDEPQ